MVALRSKNTWLMMSLISQALSAVVRGDDQAEDDGPGIAPGELAAGLAEQPGDQGERAVAGDFRQFQAKGHHRSLVPAISRRTLV